MIAQERETVRDKLAGERIEHHIHAFAAGQASHVLDEGQGARIEHVLHAQRVQEGALLRTVRCGEDLSADALGELQRGQADAAGRGVDQHPFAFHQVADVVQGVIGGQKGQRDHGRLLKGEIGGLGGDEEL